MSLLMLSDGLLKNNTLTDLSCPVYPSPSFGQFLSKTHSLVHLHLDFHSQDYIASFVSALEENPVLALETLSLINIPDLDDCLTQYLSTNDTITKVSIDGILWMKAGIGHAGQRLNKMLSRDTTLTSLSIIRSRLTDSVVITMTGESLSFFFQLYSDCLRGSEI